jgi:16S rRNA (cytidine1402-2'-O)-methyltransferase
VSGSPSPGRLWLIPTPLGDASDPRRCLPPDTVAIASRLHYFIAENARTARAFLKQLDLDRPIQQIEIRELSEHTPAAELPGLLAPILAGQEAGLVSEAGCPAVADPGAALVALAHQHQVPVHPLIGPSAILLALMASGMGGQAFAFVGYLPQQPDARLQAVRALEQRSARSGETILMIETPYRNQAIFETLLAGLSGDCRLMVASSLSLPDQLIRTERVATWRGSPVQLARVPTVFGLIAPGQASATKERERPRQRASGHRR